MTVSRGDANGGGYGPSRGLAVGNSGGSNYVYRSIPGGSPGSMGNWNTGGNVVGFGSMANGIRGLAPPNRAVGGGAFAGPAMAPPYRPPAMPSYPPYFGPPAMAPETPAPEAPVSTYPPSIVLGGYGVVPPGATQPPRAPGKTDWGGMGSTINKNGSWP